MSRVPSRGVRRAECGSASSPAVAGFRPTGAALAVAAAFLLQPAGLLAQPAGAQVIHGQASFAPSGNTLVVTTRNGAGTNHSAINWQSFSIPAGSVTRFDQPSTTSLSINRVVGPDPSAIYGTLSSNGKLVLVNPAGIAVGQGAVVDTAGFTASTLRMSDADAIAGRLAFGGGGAAGPLQVDGTILARSGDVVLIAPNVQTGSQALVQANGATILAAGQKVEITGRGLEGIRLEVQAGDEAVNLGTLKGDAVGIFAQTLKHSGVIRAQAVSTEGGKVVLQAIGGDNLVSGSVTAAAANGQGGSVDVLGQRVGLLAGASLDASGPAGGGSVRVGGDYQGRNPDVPNAQATYVDAQATIKADAADQGNGGRVIVWSDDATRMNGQISARGGPRGGDGGFAEVSGKQYLAFNGTADLRAPAGKVGTLLLDPNDVVIELDTSTTTTLQGPVFEGGSGTSYISDTDLGNQLASSNVIVTTSGSGGSGNITLASGANVSWSTNNALGLKADNNIYLSGNITAAGAGAAVSLQAGGSVAQDPSSVVRVPNLQVYAPSGSVGMPGANRVDTLAVNAGADVSFVNAQALQIGTVSVTLPSPYNTPLTVSGVIGANVGLKATAAEGADALTLNADVTGTSSVALYAASGNITQAASGSVISTPALVVATDDGGVNLSGANMVDTLAGSASGVGNDFIFRNAKDLLVGTVSTPWAEGSGISADYGTNHGAIDVRTTSGNLAVDLGGYVVGGSVSLQSAGNLDVGSNSEVVGTTGDVSLVAGGALTVGTQVPDVETGYYSTFVSAAGRLTLQGQTVTTSLPVGNDYGTYSAVNLTAGTGIQVKSTVGDIDFGSDTYLSGMSTPITIGVDAKGSVLGAADFDSYGDPGTSPAVGITAGGSISYGRINTSIYHLDSESGGGYGGSGGSVLLKAGGDITGGDITSYGDGYQYGGDAGSGGNVTLKAGGAINVGNVEAYGGYGYGGAGGNGGNVTMNAGSTINVADVDASAGGSQEYNSEGVLPAGQGGQGGTVTLTAGTGITTQSIWASGGGSWGSSYQAGTGGAGGNVTLTTTAGDISVSDVDASGGTGSAPAGAGGNIVLSAGGNISGGDLSAYGGYSNGGDGGAAGNITLNAGGAINLGEVDVSGGWAYEYDGAAMVPAGQGGRGGTVTLAAGSGITAGSIYAGGGTSSYSEYPAAAGGAAGNVTLTAMAGDITVASVDASGGAGSPPAAGGTVTLTGGNVQFGEITAHGGESYGSDPGGAGGTVNINAGGNVVMTPYLDDFAIVADGGYSDGGVGGAGGSITLKTGGVISVVPQDISCDCSSNYSASYSASGAIDNALYAGASGLSASGGWGGADGAGNGMAGGAGGTIRVQGTGAQLVLDGTMILAATGGDGGYAGTASSTGGAGGAGGSVQLVSSGTVNLRSPYVFTDGGTGGLNGDDTTYAANGALGSFTPSGSSVEVESDFAPSANWNNASLVNVRGTSVVSGPGVFQNTGTLNLYDTSTVNTAALVNSGTLNALGSDVTASTLAQNAGTVNVTAGSTLDAPQFFTNAGTVQVDGALRIGTIDTSSTTSPPIGNLSAAVGTGNVFTNQAPGVISGTGTLQVDSGAGTVDNFGTLSPAGAGTVGTLTLNAGLIMETGSIYAADILSTATHDTVVVSGGAVSGGSFAVNYVGGPTFNAGDVLRMIQSTALDATVVPTANKAELTPSASGNDVVLVANVTLPVLPSGGQQQAQQQSNNQVVTFADLFVQMSEQQQQDDKKDNQIGKDDIVVTDTACTR